MFVGIHCNILMLLLIVSGVILWQAVSEHFMPVWSSFGVLVLPDFSGDGVPELLLPHSSDPRFMADVSGISDLSTCKTFGGWLNSC
jgi:hypothetical protein